MVNVGQKLEKLKNELLETGSWHMLNITVKYKQRVLMHGHQGWNVRHGLCHIYMIYVYIWVVYSFCLFCCLFIIVTTQFVALYKPCKPKPSTYDPTPTPTHPPHPHPPPPPPPHPPPPPPPPHPTPPRTTTPWQRSKDWYLGYQNTPWNSIRGKLQLLCPPELDRHLTLCLTKYLNYFSWM